MTVGQQNQINAQKQAEAQAAQQRAEVAAAVNRFARECQQIAQTKQGGT